MLNVWSRKQVIASLNLKFQGIIVNHIAHVTNDHSFLDDVSSHYIWIGDFPDHFSKGLAGSPQSEHKI